MQTPDAPQPPYFRPIDVQGAVADAFNYDVQGYDWRRRDFLARFPGLVATNNEEVDRAYNELTGPPSPEVMSSFVNQGLSGSLNAFGGGDPLSGLGLTSGSAGRNAASANVANQLLAKQDYDRQNFSQLLGMNPQTPFGPGGSDIATLMAFNTGTLNSANQQSYTSQLAGIYGQGQQGSATGAQIAALGSILARLGGTYG